MIEWHISRNRLPCWITNVVWSFKLTVSLSDFETKGDKLYKMASADPNNPDDNDYYDDPPKTPALKLKDEEATPLTPDTEDHVAEQTDGVFRNFVYLMHTNSQDEQTVVEETPCSVELTAFHDDPFG